MYTLRGENLARVLMNHSWACGNSFHTNDKVILYLDSSGLGFNIRGGVDHPHLSYDPGIFVTTVKENTVAAKDGRIQPGDKILEVRTSNKEPSHLMMGLHFTD